MSVSNAVARRDQAVEQAGNGKPPSLAQVAKQAIDQQSHVLDAVLPAHVDRQRFSQMVLYAMKQSPELAHCFGTQAGGASFLLAVGQAAVVGLEPNTPTQECWILPRKQDQRQEAHLMIGYRGLLKLARRSGTIKTVFAEVVHERDGFRWSRGLEEDVLDHQPADGERGELTHAYAVVRYRDGGYQFAVLSRADVEARRAQSDSWRSTKARPYSPWSKWPAAMWRKSAIRALVPFLDLAAEAEAVVHNDGQAVAWNDHAGAIEATDWSAGELDAPEPTGESDEPPAGVDADTGEVAGETTEAEWPPGEEPM